jgi:hypothetical protein
MENDELKNHLLEIIASQHGITLDEISDFIQRFTEVTKEVMNKVIGFFKELWEKIKSSSIMSSIKKILALYSKYTLIDKRKEKLQKEYQKYIDNSRYISAMKHNKNTMNRNITPFLAWHLHIS